MAGGRGRAVAKGGHVVTTSPRGYCYRWGGEAAPEAPTLIEQLRRCAWLPEQASWWFGWNEATLDLPSRLVEASALRSETDVLHVFSPHVEVRWLRRGERRDCLLFCEEALPASLSGWQQTACYSVVPTQRLLWGVRQRITQRKERQEQRGVVQFPRSLNYGIAGEDQSTRWTDAVVVQALAYYDLEHRLMTVRYATIGHQVPGAKEKTDGD